MQKIILNLTLENDVQGRDAAKALMALHGLMVCKPDDRADLEAQEFAELFEYIRDTVIDHVDIEMGVSYLDFEGVDLICKEFRLKRTSDNLLVKAEYADV